MDWYDRAVEELEQDLEDGEITALEFRNNISQLNEEYEEQTK